MILLTSILYLLVTLPSVVWGQLATSFSEFEVGLLASNLVMAYFDQLAKAS